MLPVRTPLFQSARRRAQRFAAFVRAFATLLPLALACCGGPDRAPSSDASVSDARGDAAVVMPPAAVVAPMGVRCPMGLIAGTLGSGQPTCRRDPAEPTCEDSGARFYDEAACTLIGPACPVGPFPDVLPAGRVLYALPGAPAGGDGSITRPFATALEALVTATVGTTVLLGQGTFDESGLRIPRGVTLRGTCVAGTVLTSTGIAPPSAVVLSRAVETQVETLTIGPSSGLGLQVEGGALVVHDVLIRDATTAAVSIVNGTLGGSGLVVRHTRPDPTFGDSGFALFAENGAVVELDRVVLEHNGDTGVLSVAGSRITLRRAAVRDADGAPSATRGIAVSAQDGGEIVLERAEVVGHGHGGLLASAGHLAARDVVVLDSRGSAPGSGFGVDAELGGTIDLERVVIDRAERTGILLRDASSLTAVDVVIHEVGIGLIGDAGTIARVTRMEIDAPSSGVSFVGPDVSIELTDITVRGATGLMDGGFGLAMTRGGSLTIRRAAIVDTAVLGLGIHGPTAVATVSDVLVRDTRTYGAMEEWGRGIGVAGGAQVTITRARVEGNREVQVSAFDVGTRLELDELSIVRSLARSCARTSCSDAPGGSGLGAYEGSTVVARSFVIDDAELCGLQVAGNAALDVTNGAVRGAVIGACVQVEGYDVTRLAGSIAYSGNGVNIDAMSVPVPMPLDLSAF